VDELLEVLELLYKLYYSSTRRSAILAKFREFDGLKSPNGVRGGAMLGGLGDEATQKLTMFRKYIIKLQYRIV
jgi:hypothetical protein